jgi:hypothetical protein
MARISACIAASCREGDGRLPGGSLRPRERTSATRTIGTSCGRRKGLVRTGDRLWRRPLYRAHSGAEPIPTLEAFSVHHQDRSPRMSLLETGRLATAQRATSPDQGPALSSYPVRPDLLPTEESIAGRYFMRFARSPQDLGGRRASSASRCSTSSSGRASTPPSRPGRDHDELDPWFHHLMILSRDSGKAVGTYRLQTSEMAATGTWLLLGRGIRSLGASGRLP